MIAKKCFTNFDQWFCRLKIGLDPKLIHVLFFVYFLKSYNFYVINYVVQAKMTIEAN